MLAAAGAEAGGRDAASPAAGRSRRRWRPAGRRRWGWSARAGTSTPWVGAPRAARRPPAPGWAAGRGRPAPCRCRWRPGSTRTSSTPSTSRAAHVPTTSTMASRPPTSWKWTCSGGRRWSRPSTSARARKVARARWRDPVGQAGLLDQAGDVGGGADDGRSRRRGRRTWVAAMPHRSTGSASQRPSRPPGRRSSSARTSSRSAPASTSAPRAMSPAMPEKQWNQATVGHRPSLRPCPARAGASSMPERRRRRRRSRCRCRRR